MVADIGGVSPAFQINDQLRNGSSKSVNEVLHVVVEN